MSLWSLSHGGVRSDLLCSWSPPLGACRARIVSWYTPEIKPFSTDDSDWLRTDTYPFTFPLECNFIHKVINSMFYLSRLPELLDLFRKFCPSTLMKLCSMSSKMGRQAVLCAFCWCFLKTKRFSGSVCFCSLSRVAV